MLLQLKFYCIGSTVRLEFILENVQMVSSQVEESLYLKLFIIKILSVKNNHKPGVVRIIFSQSPSSYQILFCIQSSYLSTQFSSCYNPSHLLFVETSSPSIFSFSYVCIYDILFVCFLGDVSKRGSFSSCPLL